MFITSLTSGPGLSILGLGYRIQLGLQIDQWALLSDCQNSRQCLVFLMIIISIFDHYNEYVSQSASFMCTSVCLPLVRTSHQWLYKAGQWQWSCRKWVSLSYTEKHLCFLTLPNHWKNGCCPTASNLIIVVRKIKISDPDFRKTFITVTVTSTMLSFHHC